MAIDGTMVIVLGCLIVLVPASMLLARAFPQFGDRIYFWSVVGFLVFVVAVGLMSELRFAR